MTTYSTAVEGPASSGTRQSFIDRDSHFSGTHTTPNDLRVEGRFDGTIECTGTLIVAESADVNAQVTAGSVSVAGHLQGDIGCRGRFEILPTGRVEARVQAATIVVQEGARYEGEMHMGSTAAANGSENHAGEKRPEHRPARRATATPSAEVPSFTVNAGRSNGRSSSEDGAPLSVADRIGSQAPSLNDDRPL
jgi:cytoskeletal protein CcmA (bactofilin family)